MLDFTLEDFKRMSIPERCKYIKDYAVLYAAQFNREDLEYLCKLADVCRTVHKSKHGAIFMSQLLMQSGGLNFFAQASSRTFLSFSAAQSLLGMKKMDIRDASVSSIAKGESLEDTIRTFISYVDLVVMRHSDEDAGLTAFYTAMNAHRRLNIKGEERPIPIISGGSGTKHHPTQALLDIYTLEKSFEKHGGMDDKKIMMVGDLKRGRTVRSLSQLMKNFNNIELFFASPEEYKMEQDILDELDENGVKYHFLDSIREGIEDVNAVYMTRVQDEHNKVKGNGHEKTHKDFIFKEEFLKLMRDDCYLLHPLPKRDEIEYNIDYIDDPRLVYWRQERNGMWMRVALIAKLLKVDDDILQYQTGFECC